MEPFAFRLRLLPAVLLQNYFEMRPTRTVLARAGESHKNRARLESEIGHSTVIVQCDCESSLDLYIGGDQAFDRSCRFATAMTCPELLNGIDLVLRLGQLERRNESSSLIHSSR